MSATLSEPTTALTSTSSLEASYATATPELVTALRTVLVYTLTDVFSLTPQESMWVSYHLDENLSVLIGEPYDMIPIVVREEMMDGVYSKRLQSREEGSVEMPEVVGGDTKRATREDWVGLLTSITLTGFTSIRAMKSFRIQGAINGIMEELGVTDDNTSRASRFLPNTLRMILAQRY